MRAGSRSSTPPLYERIEQNELAVTLKAVSLRCHEGNASCPVVATWSIGELVHHRLFLRAQLDAAVAFFEALEILLQREQQTLRVSWR